MDGIRKEEGKLGNTVMHSGRKVTIMQKAQQLECQTKQPKALVEWKPLSERLVIARFNSKYAKPTVATITRSQ